MKHPGKKKSINKIYPTEFRGHVASFLESLKFNLKGKKLVVSVSAGVDSIALLDVMSKLNVDNLSILHFNHSTRPVENQKEEALIRRLAKKYSIPIEVIKLDFNLSDTNFEHSARLKRQENYKRLIDEGSWILCAHHIDDSFEWSLMQSFKQSGLITALGIPVFNNGILRPFMSVTKKQIIKYAKSESLIWIEDSSNSDERFERNALRKNISHEILKRYPKSLKHYVARQNLLALKLGVHALSIDENEKSQHSHQLITKRDRLNRLILKSENFLNHKDEIKACIFRLSALHRGLIDLELAKFLKLQRELLNDPKVLSVKGPHRGPVNFSGGVSGFIYQDEILLMSKKSLIKSLELDEKIVKYLKNQTKTSEITEPLYLDLFPYILITSKNNNKASSKLIHPLLSKTCSWLKQNNINYTFDSNFIKNIQQNLISSAVLLDSSRLG